ncbi:MAG: peptidylprolyl isomerase [Salinivirgaceae bacterium]|nr:peptidylprolyl isomerase [Salinivirgaceae bacterium]
MKYSISLILLVCLTLNIYAQNTGKRLALVIGNSNYTTGGALKNPVNDANLMATTLQQLGFDVIKTTNSTKAQMDKAVLDYARRLVDCDVALFYYAGHGMQLNGVNYLIPIDATLQDELSLEYEAVNVGEIVQKFEYYPDNLNIVILDACRDNPIKSFSRGGSRGFKAISARSETLIAFATREGETAADGSGNNGLFTEQLVKQMKKPLQIEDVFKQTRKAVLQKSNYKQSPQEWSMLTSEFYFTKEGVSTPPINTKLTSEYFIKEAYERMKLIVQASHILISCNSDALPADTLIAYNKANKIRQEILRGADFANVAKEKSNDKSAERNSGNLGYFSAFTMVYPFETAVYSSKIGEIPNVVRTQFGYHIIKVTDIKENPGNVKVAHIMRSIPKEGDPQKDQIELAKANAIYDSLLMGNSFEELALRNSDDKSSKNKGGELPEFGIGRMVPEFEDVAFGLTSIRDISKPIRTQYGYHIIKLLEKNPIGTFEEMQTFIIEKLKKDRYRSRFIK